MLRLNPTPSPLDGTFEILDAFVFPALSVTPPPGLPLPNPFPAQPVPTGLALDTVLNRLLIGELAGFPFVPGSANIFSKDGLNPPSQVLTGFSSITDLASGSDGSLYVLDYASDFSQPIGNGSIWRVTAGGGRERIIDEIGRAHV